MRVLLVEPYYAGSHRAWADGYAAHSRHDVRLLTHDARFWKWRMHGAAVTLAADLAASGGPSPDVVLVSDMVNVAAFRALAAASLGSAPVVLYMHENQLVYPLSPRDDPDFTYGMINWTSMASADAVWFNSRYHLDTVFSALPGFLGQFPDHRHGSLVEAVASRSSVMPPGVDLGDIPPPRRDGGHPIVLWNHRWEYDKAPQEFFDACRHLVTEGIAFRLAVCGESFGNDDPVFTTARSDFAGQIVHWGFATDRAGYVDLLASSSIVVSTALQEYWGISITEAIAAGAFPLLPDRLVYPERVPPACHADVLYEPGTLAARLAAVIAERPTVPPALREAMLASDWRTMAGRYDDALEELPAVSGRRG